jgi:protein-S-isoprenylcysteine O-methyltransferase Ste14
VPKKPQEDTLLVAFSVVDGKHFSRKKARNVPNFVMGHHEKMSREDKGCSIVDSLKTTLEIFLLSLMSVEMLGIPLIYVFTPLLSFADYQLPSWAGWIGVVISVVALWLFWRSHADLGQNWSYTLELRKGHQLITSGVYR